MTAQDDDVRRFAELLRELKGRTDRSYGSLARRLHMNTSTLHRYCAGDAVPVDFAPAERFAALCGASDAERLELHRRWLLAVEARRRPRGGTASAPGPVTAAPGPAREAGASGGGPGESGEPGGPEEPGGLRKTAEPGEPEGHAEMVTSPEGHAEPVVSSPDGDRPDAAPHREPDASARRGEGSPEHEPRHRARAGRDASVSAGSPAAGAGEDRGPVPVSGAPVAGDEASGSTGAGAEATGGDGVTNGFGHSGWGNGHDGDVVSGPVEHSGERRRRGWRRKRVVAAAAAVCAVLATVGSLSFLPDERRAPAGSEAAAGASEEEGSGASPGSGAAPGRSVAPSVSGSASASVSPSPSGSASPGHGGGGKASGAPRDAGAPTASRPAPAGPAPLTWSVDSHAWSHGCGHDYVVARPPARVPPPPAPQDARTWAAAQGAVHGKETLVELSVQGKSETAVVLTGLRVRVAGRSEPAPGNAYAMDQGCGGALTPRYFDVDLDKDRPIARAVAGNDAGTPIPAVRMPYRVSASDPEVLMVTARTRGCDCRWYLELDWSSQGRTGTVRIDDRGRPFRTSAVDGLPHYEYDTLNRSWRPRAS
ncbi:helix-turn-helix domain-containing protein [Streptomyces sp. NPDC096538]|uniref:helix-turn-helix domain-containing protein n=1 Tax=Streptomyces sp. NPDC096538 TaxID=3155427 RepID=UPI003333F412